MGADTERDVELGEGAGSSLAQQETGTIGTTSQVPQNTNVTEELDNWDENAEDGWDEDGKPSVDETRDKASSKRST